MCKTAQEHIVINEQTHFSKTLNCLMLCMTVMKSPLWRMRIHVAVMRKVIRTWQNWLPKFLVRHKNVDQKTMQALARGWLPWCHPACTTFCPQVSRLLGWRTCLYQPCTSCPPHTAQQQPLYKAQHFKDLQFC